MNGNIEFKDAGWMGSVPQDWRIRRISAIYDPRNTKVSDKDYRPLSVTMSGIVPQLGTAAKTQDGDNRKLVKAGDFAINSRSDRRGSCGISPCDGSVTLIANVLAPKSLDSMDPGYYSYLFRTEAFADEFYKQGTGIVDDLWSTNWSRMKNINICVPLIDDQRRIAEYLDDRTKQIDEIISETERSVELLEEYRRSVISEAVTKGLDPTAPMKDSGVEWIGEIPSHWESGKLLRHARLESGHTPSKQHPEWWIEEECTVPWVTTSDVHCFRDGMMIGISDTAEHISEIGLANSSARWLPAGTVALSRTASVGFSIVLEKPMASSQDFADWVPDENLDSYYLLYSLRSMDQVFKQLQMGSTHKTIYMPDIMRLCIAFPPIEEQRKIADYLKERTALIDSLISEQYCIIVKLREYRKSLISEAVTGKFKVPGVE